MNFIVNISTCSVWEVQGNKLQWRKIKLKKKKSSRDKDEERLEKEREGFFRCVCVQTGLIC